MLDAPGLSAAMALAPSPSKMAAVKPKKRFIIFLLHRTRTGAAHECSGRRGTKHHQDHLYAPRGNMEPGSEEKYETVFTCGVPDRPGRCVDCAGERDAGGKTQ